MSWLKHSLPAIAVAVTALACAARPMSSQAKLSEAVRTYNNLQRWGQWRAAARYVAPDKAAQWLAARQHAGQVKVGDIQLLQVSPGIKPDEEAVALVRISFYRMPEMRLTTVTRQQIWRNLEPGWRMAEETAVQAPTGAAPTEVPAWP